MEIPYEKIDSELRLLIKTMNQTKGLVTIGCCIGHGTNPVGNVIFKVTDEGMWKRILLELLKLSTHLSEANIDVFEWHRISVEGKYLIDWKMEIAVHPRNEECLEIEEHRLQRVKNLVLLRICDLLRGWQNNYFATRE